MVCILRCIISSEGWGIVYPANTTWIQSDSLNCGIERRHFSSDMRIWCCFKANSFTVKPRWLMSLLFYHWRNSRIYRISPPPLSQVMELVQYVWSFPTFKCTLYNCTVYTHSSISRQIIHDKKKNLNQVYGPRREVKSKMFSDRIELIVSSLTTPRWAVKECTLFIKFNQL